MTTRLPRIAVSVALLLCLTAVTPHEPLTAQDRPRIVAIGDIHGAYDEFTRLLQQVGLVDDRHRWSGGSAILVQTGDVPDRGAQVREVWDLLMTLERQADAAGGQVVALLGNHETMNLMRNVRDVGPGAYASFADGESEDRRQEAYQAYAKLSHDRIAALGHAPPNLQTEEEWMATHPLGFVEYLEAIGPEGRYGRWLRSKPVVVRVGDAIFMHGGIDPDLAPATLEDINKQARREIQTFDDFHRHLVDRKMILPFFTFDESLAAAQSELAAWVERVEPVGPPAPGRRRPVLRSRDRDHINLLLNILNVGMWSIVKPNGPVWFRGFARWPPEEGRLKVMGLLDQYSVSHFVVGHTILSTQLVGRPYLRDLVVAGEDRITARFGARVFLIDTGMLSSHYEGGRASALEIEGDRITAVYLDERIPLVDPATTPSR